MFTSEPNRDFYHGNMGIYVAVHNRLMVDSRVCTYYNLLYSYRGAQNSLASVVVIDFRFIFIILVTFIIRVIMLT